MIVHALSIRRWANIGELHLDGLGQSLVVLHGANRTGKSSIVRALRGTLFDFDHDTRHRELQEMVPWDRADEPEVTVEFETGGVRYRLFKRFSAKKSGEAKLEQLGAGDRWLVLHAGKEASRETRRLLGAEKSAAGLYQLLWLDHGANGLPPEKDLDGSLRQQLESVLGSLLTARDHRFEEALHKACARWFTPQMRDRKDAEPSRLEADRATRLQNCRELRAKAAAAERDVTRIESLRLEQKEEEERIETSEQEVAGLRAARRAVEERRVAFARAEADMAAARKICDEIAARLAKHAEVTEKLAKADRGRRLADDAVAESVARRESAAKTLAESSAAVAALRSADADLDAERSALRDRRRLVEIARECDTLAEAFARLEDVDRRLAALRTEEAERPAPDKKALESLKAEWQEAARLRARLEAGSLHVEVETPAASSFSIVVDQAAPVDVETRPGIPDVRTVRQSAALDVPGFGSIRLRRGQEATNLEQEAARLDTLDANLDAARRTFGLAPESFDDAAAIEELSLRRALADERKKSRDDLLKQRKTLAPDGTDPPDARRTALADERSRLLASRPALATWEPHAAALRSIEEDVEQRTQARQAKQTRAEQDRDAAQNSFDAAQTDENRARLAAAEQSAACGALVEQLKSLGAEAEIRQNLEFAEQRRAECARRFAAAQLTDEERGLDDRLKEAEAALHRRVARRHECEGNLRELQGRLDSLGGLHERLASEEAALFEVSRRLRAEKLEAEAHRLLRSTFEACRSDQVRRTTGRIGEQVLTWAKRLGLDDYADLRFDAGFLPVGTHRADVADAVGWDRDSFGTQEQLGLLVRFAVGRLLAKDERQTAVLDDPLVHADARKHRRMLEILAEAALPSKEPLSAGLQVLVFTCHPDRFDHLAGARHVDLETEIVRA